MREFLRARWQGLRPRLPWLNAGLALAAYLANEFWEQVFCQPVGWAALVLLGSVGAFLAWPWLPTKAPAAVRYGALLLQGAVAPVGAYCVWFLSPRLLLVSIFLFFIILPLLAWVPVLFVAQALWRGFTTTLPGGRLVFALGVLGPLAAQVWAEGQYRAIEAAVAQLPPSRRRQPAALLAVVPRTYMAERLAGALFKYHNYYTSYDGWRPPLHDPLVNVCLWSRSGQNFEQPGVREANPLLVHNQAAFYHALFPNLPIRADCVCAHTPDGESYRH